MFYHAQSPLSTKFSLIVPKKGSTVKAKNINPQPSTTFNFRPVTTNILNQKKQNQNEKVIKVILKNNNKENLCPNVQKDPAKEPTPKKLSEIPSDLTEYTDEMYATMITDSAEQDYSLDSILSVQKDINAKMRSILIDWLISLHSHFPLKENTLFITVNIIDRYISKKFIHRSKFQLLGITAFFLAAKYEEIYFPECSRLAKMTDGAATYKEIISFEHELLSVLDFRISIPHQLDIYQFMSLKYKFSRKEFYFGLFMLEAFLLDINSTKYLPFVICESACYLVMKIVRKDEGNNEILVGSNKVEIKQCILEMYVYCRDITTTNLKAVLAKFKDEKYNKTSEIYGGI